MNSKLKNDMKFFLNLLILTLIPFVFCGVIVLLSTLSLEAYKIAVQSDIFIVIFTVYEIICLFYLDAVIATNDEYPFIK